MNAFKQIILFHTIAIVNLVSRYELKHILTHYLLNLRMIWIIQENIWKIVTFFILWWMTKVVQINVYLIIILICISNSSVICNNVIIYSNSSVWIVIMESIPKNIVCMTVILTDSHQNGLEKLLMSNHNINPDCRFQILLIWVGMAYREDFSIWN